MKDDREIYMEALRISGDQKRDDMRPVLILENLPPDMDWNELKAYTAEYGVTTCYFATTFRWKDKCCGMLRFKAKQDAETVKEQMNGGMIEGCVEVVNCKLLHPRVMFNASWENHDGRR